MESDLAIGVAELRAQVPAVNFGQLEGRQMPHPQEQRQLWVLGILRKLAGDLDEGLLKHVGIVDPAGQAPAEPQVDHPLQPVAMGREQRAQGFIVAGGGPPEHFGLAVFTVGLRVVHNLYSAVPDGSSPLAGGFLIEFLIRDIPETQDSDRRHSWLTSLTNWVSACSLALSSKNSGNHGTAAGRFEQKKARLRRS